MNKGQSADSPGYKKESDAQNQNSNIRIFNDIRFALGEGPAWGASSKSLYWVDILGKEIYSATMDGSIESSWSCLDSPSAVILSSSGNVLVTAGQEVLELCPESGQLTPILHLSGEAPCNRCNDAKCDPLGNLWVGTMDSNEKERVGRLWRFDSSGKGVVLLDGIGIANTLAWDMQRGRFYFADSMLGDIYVFDYDSSSAEIRRRRPFFSRDKAPGVPDGSAIDEEGFLWNARWDGNCVIRISPEGEVDRIIDLPVRRPTSCAFGGEDMRTLFVTSAATEQPASHGHANIDGAILSINVNVAGSRIPPYTRSI